MKKAPGLNWKAAIALSALALGSLILPQVFAPLAAAAFLYIVPGYLLIRLLNVKLEPLEALALSLLCSIMVSTFAIYWLSMLLGYSTLTFTLFFALVSATSLFVRGMPKIEIPKGAFAPLALAVVTGLIIFLILHFSLWVPTAKGVIVGGWNYGDYFVHASVMQSVNNGNFPPDEPIYAGVPLRYHWFADFHTAIVSKLTAMFHVFPAIVDTSLGVGLFSLLAYLVAFRFTKDHKAALICALLVVFGSGLGYLRLWDEMGKTPITQLLRGDPFDNNWKFFQVASILPGYLLDQRPMAIGLPALAAVLLLVATGYPNDKRRLLLAGIILGMLAPFQYFALLTAALLSTLWFALHYEKKRGFGDLKTAFIFVVLPALILAAPFLLDAAGRAGGMTKLGLFWFVPVFDGAPKGDIGAFADYLGKNLNFDFLSSNILAFVKFYAANLGLPFLLAIPGYVLLKSKEKRFLALGIALVFLIPNLVTFSNMQWDMSKFFTCEWLLACVLAAVAIARLPQWLWPAIMLLCCFSAITGMIFYVTSGWEGMNNEDVAAGQWIFANTPERAVFASSSAHTLPIGPIGGRLRLLGYVGWVVSYGLDFGVRETDLKQIYCGPRENVPALMRKYNADYVYVSPKEVSEWKCQPNFNIPGFTKEYSSARISIYRFSG